MFSTDPELVAKATDVVGFYLASPANAIVLCVDGKNRIQAIDRTQPTLAIRPGLTERQTQECVLDGETTLFTALEVTAGGAHKRVEIRQ